MYQCINTVIYIDLRARQECDSLATVPRYVKRLETVCLMAKLSVMTAEDTQLPQKTTWHFSCEIEVELKLTFRNIKKYNMQYTQYAYMSENWLFCLKEIVHTKRNFFPHLQLTTLSTEALVTLCNSHNLSFLEGKNSTQRK